MQPNAQWKKEKTKNTKSSQKHKITTDESADKIEKAKTTISNIVMHSHDDVTHLDEMHEDYLIGKDGSEMKPIQKDHKVEMHIHREFSVNKSVEFVGEKNDENHAVPSVMKLIEKLKVQTRCRLLFFCCGPYVFRLQWAPWWMVNTLSLPVVAPHGDDDRDAFVHLADMFSGIPRWR